MRTVHALSAADSVPAEWGGAVGFVDTQLIRNVVPDHLERTFYVSGPPAMVTAARKAIAALGVKSSRIRTDYFPGFA